MFFFIILSCYSLINLESFTNKKALEGNVELCLSGGPRDVVNDRLLKTKNIIGKKSILEGWPTAKIILSRSSLNFNKIDIKKQKENIASRSSIIGVKSLLYNLIDSFFINISDILVLS